VHEQHPTTDPAIAIGKHSFDTQEQQAIGNSAAAKLKSCNSTKMVIKNALRMSNSRMILVFRKN
jgi:hypothetical protein